MLVKREPFPDRLIPQLGDTSGPVDPYRGAGLGLRCATRGVGDRRLCGHARERARQWSSCALTEWCDVARRSGAGVDNPAWLPPHALRRGGLAGYAGPSMRAPVGDLRAVRCRVGLASAPWRWAITGLRLARQAVRRRAERTSARVRLAEGAALSRLDAVCPLLARGGCRGGRPRRLGRSGRSLSVVFCCRFGVRQRRFGLLPPRFACT
jgi:hypothetical protein